MGCMGGSRRMPGKEPELQARQARQPTCSVATWVRYSSSNRCICCLHMCVQAHTQTLLPACFFLFGGLGHWCGKQQIPPQQPTARG